MIGGDVGSPLADEPMSWPVVSSETVYDGAMISLRRDLLAQDDGDSFARDVVVHPGSVAMVALDDAERVLVVTQYRHPAEQRLVELPAGLLDVAGEAPEDAARRELAEEGHLQAARWSVLLRLMPSPGISTEVITIYLAEGVSELADSGGFVPRHEEADLTRTWVPLGELRDAVLAGRVSNAPLVAGVLAAAATRQR
jgi:ADP-ribose pyrophosphatase